MKGIVHVIIIDPQRLKCQIHNGTFEPFRLYLNINLEDIDVCLGFKWLNSDNF